MKTSHYIMTVGDIGKARRLENFIVKALEEAGYTLTDFNRVWDPEKPIIRIRYYDKCEPTWNFTHHTVEIVLTREECKDYASAGIDKIVKAVREDTRNRRKDLYKLAYSNY